MRKLALRCDEMAIKSHHLSPSSQLRRAKGGRRRTALGALPHHGRLLPAARVPGDQRAGEDGAGRHGGQVRQQRVEQQEAQAPHHLHQRAARGAGESVPENPLPGCLREGAAGHEDGADGGQGAGRQHPQRLSCLG